MKKNNLKGIICAAGIIISIFSSCNNNSNSSGSSPTPGTTVCQASEMALTETKVNDLSPSSSGVIIDFDIKNNSSRDYDPSKESNPKAFIYSNVVVETTDGMKYETENILPINSLKKGSIATTSLMGKYGTGKIYKNYKVSLYCK